MDGKHGDHTKRRTVIASLREARGAITHLSSTHPAASSSSFAEDVLDFEALNALMIADDNDNRDTVQQLTEIL